MQRTPPADSSLFILPDLNARARETGLVVLESRKMEPSTFLQTLYGGGKRKRGQ